LIVVNPYGPAYLAYLRDALSMDRSLIAEWRPLGDGYPAALVAWGLSLTVLAYGVARRGIRDADGVLLVIATAVLALRHQRHVSIYAVVWLAQVPPLVERSPLGALVRRWWTASPRRVAVVMSLVIAWAGSRAWAVAPWRLDVPTQPRAGAVVFPAGAVGYLATHGFHGHLMTPFEAGAFVSWKLHPDVQVSLDGRYEAAFDHQLVVEHVVFYGAVPGWEAVRAKYATDAVLVPAGAPIASVLEAEAAWPLVYEDDAYRIYARPGLALPVVDERGRVPIGTFP
jgi:hypothetical protein